MTDNVRLKPRIQYVKEDTLDAEWKEVKDISVWYIYDADEDEYFDAETSLTAKHKRNPGVCVSFQIGKKEVSLTIPWKNLVHAMSDVIKEDERWKEEQKAFTEKFTTLFSRTALEDSSTQD